MFLVVLNTLLESRVNMFTCKKLRNIFKSKSCIRIKKKKGTNNKQYLRIGIGYYSSDKNTYQMLQTDQKFIQLNYI